MITGCAEKVKIVEKTKYEKAIYPKLKFYYIPHFTLKAKSKGQYILINKKHFGDFKKYIESMKTQLIKYNFEIKEYNKKYTN
jgi:hypothetical protein